MSAPTYADFLADPNRSENLLVEVVGWDTIDNVERTYRFSSLDYTTMPSDTPANQLFDKRIVGKFQRVTSAVGGDGGARQLAGFFPSQTGAVVRLKQFFGDLDTGAAPCLLGTPIRQVAFGGRAITVRHGGTCAKGALPYANYRVLADGVVDGQALVDLAEVRLKIKGKEERLKTPAQRRRLFGLGRCLVFNGTTTEVDCGTDAAFNFTSGAFSISFPIFVEAYPATEASIIQRGAASTDGWNVRLGTAGGIRFATNQSGAAQVTISDPIPLDRLVWVDINRDGAAATIRFEGEDVTDTAAVHVNPTGNAARHLYIGRNDDGSIHFEGALGQIWIRGAATTEDEFAEWMHRPLDSSEFSTFLGLWRCNDGFGSGVATLDNVGSVGSAADGAITDGYFAASCHGSADLAGRIMPSTWGQYKFFSPICVDVGTQIYLVHGARSEELTTIRVGGADAYTAGTTFTSWLDFAVATTADGAVDRCLSAGWTLFRIGGAPRLKPTVDGKGDKSDGTYRSTVGALIRYIVATCGESPFDDSTEIDDDSFDDYEAAHTATVGYTFADERPVERVITDLAQTYGSGLWIRRTNGRLAIKHFDDPQTETPVVTLTRESVRSGGISPMERGAPFGLVIIRYDENPTVMGAADLYEELGDDDVAAFARVQWRKAVGRLPSVFRVYLDAATLDVETRFITPIEANARKARIANLSKEPDQGFSFHCRPQALELDFGDVVILHVQDLDEYRELQNRLATHDDARFYVIGISDHEQGGYVLDLWRPRAV